MDLKTATDGLLKIKAKELEEELKYCVRVESYLFKKQEQGTITPEELKKLKQSRIKGKRTQKELEEVDNEQASRLVDKWTDEMAKDFDEHPEEFGLDKKDPPAEP